MNRSPKQVYQLKVALEGSKPPIWRRFLVADSVSLAQLHDILQVVMGWEGGHLHEFDRGGERIGLPDPDFDGGELTDERKVRLNQLLKLERDYLKYVYDFGDDWSHRITLEKILAYDPQLALPVCVKAKGACPPEDVGGIWGYYELLDALRDPQHPSHAEYAEWIGGEFDPDAYNLVEVNARLQALHR